MASPEKRVRDIALFMIVISGAFLLASLAAWGHKGPIIGELSRFSDAVNRVVLLPCGIVGVLTGAGLLCKWNWARILMVGICALTCVVAALLLISLLFMPLGAEPGESRVGLLTLKVVVILLAAAPVLIPLRWIRLLISGEAKALFKNRERSLAGK